MGFRLGAMTKLFKHDRPEDAGYFITSATRQALERLKKRSGNCRAGLATYGRLYFGLSVINTPDDLPPMPTKGFSTR